MATLQELLKIKKKSDASKSAKDSYEKEWLLYVNTNGYTKEAEDYLYQGLAFKGAAPYYAYFKKKDNKEELLSNIFKSQLYHKDNSKTFFFLVNLLALLINNHENSSYIAMLIRELPPLSINKEKKRLGKISVLFQKHFIKELHKDIILPELTALKLDKNIICEFRLMVEDAVKQLNGAVNKGKDSIVLDKINTWIRENKNQVSENGEIRTENKNKPDFVTAVDNSKDKNDLSDKAPNKLPDPFVDRFNVKQNVEKKFISVEECAQLKQENDKLQSLLKKDEENARNFEKEKKNFHVQKLLLEEAKEHAENEIKVLTNKVNDAGSKINDKNKIIEKLGDSIQSLEQDILNLKKIIYDKDTDIKEKSKLIEILRTSGQKEIEIFTNKLAANLRVDYRDFHDADKMPMTVDLGENMRLQLENVFKVLQKCGIKF